MMSHSHWSPLGLWSYCPQLDRVHTIKPDIIAQRWVSRRFQNVKYKKLRCRRQAARLWLSLRRCHVAQGSHKVIGNGTVRKLGTVSYSHSVVTVALRLTVSTQYTNVSARHRTTARAALCSLARLHIAAKPEFCCKFITAIMLFCQ